MAVLFGVLTIGISLICPLIGILISAPITFFYHKNNFLIMLVFILLLGYIGYFYAPRQIDDMERYIFYMQSIKATSAIDYLHQIFATPISIQGLNGAEWPGSGLILYWILKYSNYRLLSAATLVITYGSRLMVVKKNYLDTNSNNQLKVSLWLLTIFVTLQPYLALSGFRWYLSISVLMIVMYFEIEKGFRLSYLWFYLLAASFHPGALIFTFLRILALLISKKKNEKRLAVGVVSVSLVVGIVKYSKVLGIIKSFVNDFMAYTRSSTSLRRIDNFAYFIILMLILVTVIKLRRDKNSLPILNYLLILVAFNMVLVDFSVFSRLVQFTIPTAIIILSKVSFLKKKLYWWELVIPISILILSVLNLIIVHYASFPPLLLPLKEILLRPIQ